MYLYTHTHNLYNTHAFGKDSIVIRGQCVEILT